MGTKSHSDLRKLLRYKSVMVVLAIMFIWQAWGWLLVLPGAYWWDAYWAWNDEWDDVDSIIEDMRREGL